MNVNKIIKESVNRLPYKTITKYEHAIGDSGRGRFKCTYKVDALGNEECVVMK